MEEIREVAVPDDLQLLERFLEADPVEFLPLIARLKEQLFPKAYASIRGKLIRTLVTIEKKRSLITIWPGEPESVSRILRRWGFPKGTVSVRVKHLLSVLEVYRPVRAFDEIFTMFVDGEHFVFKPKHDAERLSSEELPEPWTEDFEGVAYGIGVEGKIVSCGTVSGIVEEIGACGAAIGTDPEYSGRGYATSTLSYAVRDALKIIPIVTYPVESDNIAAIRVLEKLGFRFHSSFLHTEVERIQ